MSLEDQHLRPMAKGRLLLLTLLTFVAAFVIVFGAIVPAEFGRDPTGLGKLGGLSRLWAPPEKTIDPNAGSAARAHEYPTGYRTDVIEIPLTSFLGGHAGSELEYKVRLKKDATFIYEWTVTGADRADDFHYDFHGHTTPAPGEAMTVATYRQAFGLHQQGALNAPFEGIHGWQFSNSSEKPVVVRIKLAGFYDLIPAGEEGNLAGIVANAPAARSRPATPPELKG
jgi:hypothetical protein